MSSALPTRVPRIRKSSNWLRAWAAGACLLLAACATPQTDSLRARPGDLTPRIVLADTPFHAQRTKECGPAALAMAMGASGLDVSPDILVKQVYTPEREGSLATDLLAGARRYGRVAYPVAGLRDMLLQVSAGTPVLVMQNLGLEALPQWHFAVVIGYDIEAGTITLHSGTTPRLTMSMVTFERTWTRADNWGLVVLKPGRLPVNADIGRYLDAAAGLERAGRFAAAHAAYSAGLDHWRGNLSMAMGAGNALYEMGKLRDAAAMFERAGAAHPKAGDAFNNLAHVRRELGQIEAAEAAALRAVALGGPHAGIYRETLASIQKQKTGAATQ